MLAELRFRINDVYLPNHEWINLNLSCQTKPDDHAQVWDFMRLYYSVVLMRIKIISKNNVEEIKVYPKITYIGLLVIFYGA